MKFDPSNTPTVVTQPILVNKTAISEGAPPPSPSQSVDVTPDDQGNTPPEIVTHVPATGAPNQ